MNTANLGAVDILAVRLWLDRKVCLPLMKCMRMRFCSILNLETCWGASEPLLLFLGKSSTVG